MRNLRTHALAIQGVALMCSSTLGFGHNVYRQIHPLDAVFHGGA